MIHTYAANEIVKDAMSTWLTSKHFTYFLSVQLPNPTGYYELSIERLEVLMKRFQKELIGRSWHKKHLPFIGIVERGDDKIYHYHLLIRANDYTYEQLQSAINATCGYMKITAKTFNLQKINRTPEILSTYCTKEMTTENVGGRVIASDDLFNTKTK
jgi:hypothetical protein